jgi:hydrogenase expression/formation protein HypC
LFSPANAQVYSSEEDFHSMCLAIPGKVLQAEEQNGLRVGRVQFGGIVRSVRLDFVPEAEVGDYVMVHVGFAISQVDEAEAERTYELLREMGALEAELPPGEDSTTQ